MSNKALWEVLDNYTVSSEEYDYDEFMQYLTDVLGPEYDVEVWDHEDYAASEIAENVICWTNDHAKGKILEDLQVGTWWTEDNEQCYTVVILKTKEV